MELSNNSIVCSCSPCISTTIKNIYEYFHCIGIVLPSKYSSTTIIIYICIRVMKIWISSCRCISCHAHDMRTRTLTWKKETVEVLYTHTEEHVCEPHPIPRARKLLVWMLDAFITTSSPKTLYSNQHNIF